MRLKDAIIHDLQTGAFLSYRGFFVILLIIMAIAYPVSLTNSDEVVEINVTFVERTENRYLIYTEDEVFENTDSFWFQKWNSSDYYQRLEQGGVIEVVVAGWRVPWASMYRNIIEIKDED